MRILPTIASSACILLLLQACSPETVSESRFVEPDKLCETLEANIREHPDFERVADIDHARLAAKAGSPMPPAHMLIWSDPALAASILQINPLAGRERFGPRHPE